MVKKQYEEQAAPAPEYHGMTDEDLMERVVEHKDREAFSALYGRYAAPLKTHAAQKSLRGGDVWDAVQETMLNVWKFANSRRARRIEVVSPWILTIENNVIIDAARRSRAREAVRCESDLLDRSPRTRSHPVIKRPEEDDLEEYLLEVLSMDDEYPEEYRLDQTEDPGEDIWTGVKKAEQARIIREALDRLEKKDRDLIIAYYFNGKSIDDCAQDFHTKKNTIKSRLFSARKKLLHEVMALQGAETPEMASRSFDFDYLEN